MVEGEDPRLGAQEEREQTCRTGKMQDSPIASVTLVTCSCSMVTLRYRKYVDQLGPASRFEGMEEQLLPS